jgi:hypothetical protein
MPRAFRRSLIAWFAACSLLLNGVLPLAAQAAPSLPAMAICSAGSGTAPAISGKSLTRLTHCLDCCSGNHQPGLPELVAAPLHAARAAQPLPAARSLPFRRGQPLLRTQPRAPPRA